MATAATTGELHPRKNKRMIVFGDGKDTGTNYAPAESSYNRRKRPHLTDHSDPFSIPNVNEELERSIYGSVTKDVEDLRARRLQLLRPLLSTCPSLANRYLKVSPQSPINGRPTHDPPNEQNQMVLQVMGGQTSPLASRKIIFLDDDSGVIDSSSPEDSKSICKSHVDEIQGQDCKTVLSEKSCHGTIGYTDMRKIDDLSNDNRQIVILDSDDEENTEQIGTAHASGYSQDAPNFEVTRLSQDSYNLGLEQNKGLLTLSDKSFDEAHSDHCGKNKHRDVLDPHTVPVAGQKAYFPRQDVEKNAEQKGATHSSGYSQDPLNFGDTSPSRSHDSYNLGLDRQKGLVTHLDKSFNEAHGEHCGRNKHTDLLQDPYAAPIANQKAYLPNQDVVLKKPIEKHSIKDVTGICNQKAKRVKELKTPDVEEAAKKDKGVYIGVQNDLNSNGWSHCDSNDGLGDIWREMTVALECNKDASGDNTENSEDEEGEECDHSFLLKDDLGYVCRVCGVIRKSIDTIFDYQWGKGSKITRTYVSDSRSMKEREQNIVSTFSGVDGSHHLEVLDISLHPRHMKQMKPHQLEGFNFLVKNLISDKPGGCILAHAPGSGKTFMIICFIQSFLAKYPNARPLVVLPKGILGTWKKEFIRWQVEDIPLYDFYSTKADSRKDQLNILKEWVEHKGILFLGYKQFANIVSKSESNAASACQDILLKVPTILICDEGHTPRNQDTDVLHSLEKVQTPRKVVLSGTLYQNHVKEVFNILNLVRPKFLKSETSKVIKRRVMSRGHIGRKQIKTGVDATFFDVVEETLQKDENSNRKVAVIQDLREMTKNVLHYYKGDFLDELPGLVDVTVLLNLSLKQKQIVEKLKALEKFKRTSIGTAVYVHPQLKEFSESAGMADKSCSFSENKMNDLIKKMDLRDGVKAKFFFNILGLCESSGEKLLVFSQYLLPLKFLERLLVNRKGWSPGKEIFMINGDTSPEGREWSMECFNTSPDAKVFFGSIKACGEGISLVGASRILIMDVHLNPSVTRQALGRAFRPGQVRKVYVYRLVASDSPEEESHNTSFRKELVSKMWFEWSEHCSNSKFEMENVNVQDIDDEFWECPSLREDVNVVKQR